MTLPTATEHSRKGVTSPTKNHILVEANLILTTKPTVLMSTHARRPQDEMGQAKAYTLEEAKRILAFDQTLIDGAITEHVNGSWNRGQQGLLIARLRNVETVAKLLR